MSKVVVVERFGCPGSDRDCPPEGYKILESSVPGFNAGEMLVDIESLRQANLKVEIVEEEILDDEMPEGFEYE